MEPVLNEEVKPSVMIDRMIAGLPSWQAEKLGRLRALIHETAPALNEEWKWGTAIWSLKGNVLGLAAFKDHIKINFFKGAELDDPRCLYNSGLEAKSSRSIDFFETDNLPEADIARLIRSAAALGSGKSANKKGGRK